jgi:hypothetical protein
LKWLRENVRNHIIRWHVLQLQLLRVNSIFDKEETDVDVPRSGRVGPTILDQLDGRSVVLVKR